MAFFSPGLLSAQDISHPIQIPAKFHHGLIIVEPVSMDGDTLRFFTDTADATLMYRSAVDRHSLVTTSAIVQDRQKPAAFLPPFDSTRFIPPPLISDGLIPVRDDNRKPPHHRFILGSGHATGPGDGLLGATWFADRAWSINYRDETFFSIPISSLMDKGYFLPDEDAADSESPEATDSDGPGAFDSDSPEAANNDDPIDANNDSPDDANAERPGTPNNNIAKSAKHRLPENVVPLYFHTEGNRRVYHYPGLHVTIAGDTFAMVLKTGSNIILSDAARNSLGHSGDVFPAGLISESIANRWMESHPDWPVYDAADRHYGSAVIEVPEVSIGPHTAGPVRFAIRRDDAFTEWFSQFTGLPVVGAIGPDAFQNAHITINYPGSVLIFHDH